MPAHSSVFADEKVAEGIIKYRVNVSSAYVHSCTAKASTHSLDYVLHCNFQLYPLSYIQLMYICTLINI